MTERTVSRRAVFLDVDGTLFDTRRDLAATVNHTRRDLGLRELAVGEVVVHVGQGARHLLANAIPEAARPFEELWAIFRSHYAEHCCETLTPYPGVLDTLHELARRGWRLGINTNKPNFAVRAILEKFNLTDLFGRAVVAGGDGVALKPNAESIRVCADRLGHALSPADWMVGDSWTDLACATNAEVKSAFCAYGFGSRREASCTAVIDHFAGLLDILD